MLLIPWASYLQEHGFMFSWLWEGLSILLGTIEGLLGPFVTFKNMVNFE